MKSQVLKGFLPAVKNPAWLCFLWVGMTAGVSFLAIPEIFSAPSMTRPVALDAARVVFEALGKVELLALAALLILVRVSDLSKTLWAYVGVLTLIQLAQSAWLLPELATRAQQISMGIEPGASPAHAIYSVLAITKILFLLFLGFHSLRPQQRQH